MLNKFVVDDLRDGFVCHDNSCRLNYKDDNYQRNVINMYAVGGLSFAHFSSEESIKEMQHPNTPYTYQVHIMYGTSPFLINHTICIPAQSVNHAPPFISPQTQGTFRSVLSPPTVLGGLSAVQRLPDIVIIQVS